MELMRNAPDKFWDLAIVDPPYALNAPKMNMGSNPKRKGGGGYPSESTANKLRKGRLNQGAGKLKNRILNKSEIDWDNEIPSDEYFKELFRVSKNQVIWGGNYFNLGPCRGFAIWNKLQPWDNFSQAEFAWTSFDCPAKVFSYSNTGGANTEEKIHPTQKPVALYKWLLQNYAKPGDKILDTHLGSGSHRIAAYDMGFDFWGCENKEIYFELEEARFENHKKVNQQLFNASEMYDFKQDQLFEQ